MHGLSRRLRASYLRSFVFGVEDSLVSTVGLLCGVAAADASRGTILITGTVLIFVEAFSMGVGTLLSEHEVEEYERRADTSLSAPVATSIVMFISYFVTGFIPLLPYLFLDRSSAFWTSIVVSLSALFVLGAFAAQMRKTSILKHGLQMLIIGGLAIGVGVLVGHLVQLAGVKTM